MEPTLLRCQCMSRPSWCSGHTQAKGLCSMNRRVTPPTPIHQGVTARVHADQEHAEGGRRRAWSMSWRRKGLSSSRTLAHSALSMRSTMYRACTCATTKQARLPQAHAHTVSAHSSREPI